MSAVLGHVWRIGLRWVFSEGKWVCKLLELFGLNCCFIVIYGIYVAL